LPHLMPMPTPFDGYVETLSKVTSTCLTSVARNRYSAPCELVGQRVSMRLYPERVDLVVADHCVASHRRLTDYGRTSYDWQHYIPLIERKPGALRNGAPFADLPAPLATLRRGLLKREGGDRVMAKVLAAVPAHGLEAVLVAVELVLESGVLSVEHVMNVITRIKHPPAIPSIETALIVQDAPVADTGRYDALRSQEVDHA